MLAVALHRQLLQIGREAPQVLLVRQHGHRLRTEEVVVPDGQQAQEHRQVALERRGAEVLVHLVEAIQHGSKVLRADREHRRQADGRVHRVASAHPVPEPEHVGGIDAEPGHLFRIRRHRDEMPGHGLGVAAEGLEQPRTRALRVGHRLQRGERLRGDDDERLRRVEVEDRFGEIGAVDVGHEAEGQGAIAVVLQRLVGHHRPEVGAADADIDDVADALSGVPRPRAAADPIREFGHPVEHRVDLVHHVLPVENDRGPSRCAQGHVQHRPPLGDVDPVSPEHRVDPPSQARFLRQAQEQPERLVGDAILRVVEVEADGLRRHALAARGVVGKEPA